jgi:uncharacterized protein (TIGR03067 family)
MNASQKSPMKSCVFLALAIGLFVAAGDVKADSSTEDLAAMQGTWTAISGEVQGQKVTDDAIRVYKIIVKGNTITFMGTLESTFELDVTKTPKVIAVTPLDGPRKGKTQRAIYSLENGIFKVCMASDPAKGNAQPPKELATRPGDGLAIVTLKRDTATR